MSFIIKNILLLCFLVFFSFFSVKTFAFLNIDEVSIEKEIQKENYEEAIYLCNKILKNKAYKGNILKILLMKAESEWKAGFIDESILTFNKILKIDPKNQTALWYLANFYLQTEEYKKAKDLILKIKDKEKRNYLLGLFYLKERKYNSSIKFFKKTINTTYQNQSLVYISQIYENQGQDNIALFYLEKIDKNSDLFPVAKFLENEIKRTKLSFFTGIGYDNNVLLDYSNNTQKSFKDFLGLDLDFWIKDLNFNYYISYEKNFDSSSLENIIKNNFLIKKSLTENLFIPFNFEYLSTNNSFYNNNFAIGLSYLWGIYEISSFIEYNNFEKIDIKEENRDGITAKINLLFNYYINRYLIVPSFSFSYKNAKGDNWDHWSLETNLQGFYSRNRIFLSLLADFSFSNYLNRNSIYNKDREDFFFKGKSILGFYIRKNISLNLSFSFEDNSSTIEDYSYERIILSSYIKVVF